MLGKADPGKAYHKAVKALTEAEAAFQGAMDDVQRARESEQWDSVPGLRKRCQRAESALDDALAAAQNAHRDYWLSRAAGEVPNLKAAALTLRRYGRMVRASGGNDLTARGVFDSFEFQPEEVDPCEDVPTDGPDSEFVQSIHDATWKPRY
jgi:hypothetical protein